MGLDLTTKNHMVGDLYAENLPSTRQFPCAGKVLSAWGWIAVRMIVHDNDPGAIGLDGCAEQFPSVDLLRIPATGPLPDLLVTWASLVISGLNREKRTTAGVFRLSPANIPLGLGKLRAFGHRTGRALVSLS